MLSAHRARPVGRGLARRTFVAALVTIALVAAILLFAARLAQTVEAAGPTGMHNTLTPASPAAHPTPTFTHTPANTPTPGGTSTSSPTYTSTPAPVCGPFVSMVSSANAGPLNGVAVVTSSDVWAV